VRYLDRTMTAVLVASMVLVLFVMTARAWGAEVEITLNWSPPASGGPVAAYEVTCTGDIPVSTTTTETSVTAGGEFESGVISGACEVRAVNAAGPGPAATAAYSLDLNITLPPGPPTDFTLQFNCSVSSGLVTCEQV
jgi:hypothetical protein